ncbi:uncharacterized protein LOC129271821 isoform X2 [Lytechinus pictus]|uniref:uncharacterized protein LOC129271821 isoform X2 n=1 Tax=Lytechinus pictus TaxID=7653 RepID=UPI0030BA1845
MSVIGGLTYTTIFIDVNIIAIDLRKSFYCPVSSRNISVTLACDGYYDCDYFEDELFCNNTVTYLEEGQSHSISTPSFTKEFYNTTLLKVNTTNGFRIVFHRLYSNSYDDEIRIGTGNDPSDVQSIVTTIHGYAYYAEDVYIDTHKMWVVVMGSKQYSHLDLDISITAIDLFMSFPCTSSYMNVSVTLVCDGYYDCDNYEDESLCEYPASYLQPGESYFIYLTHNTTRRRLYNTHFLQTDAINGFQIIFRDLYLNYDEQIQIGKGNDPSDLQSVITTINGYRHCCPNDVYVESSDMWIVIIGGMDYSNLELYAEIISTDLSTLYRCSISDKSVPTSALCDGFYHCDHFEDELACNHSARFLASGQSTFITAYFVDSGHFGISVLSTNVTALFRLEFQEDHRQNSEETILIGTGNDVKSAIRTFHGDTPYHSDIYVGSNVIWIAIVGHKDYNYYGNYHDSYESYYDSYDYSYDNSDINLKVTAIDRSNLQECGMTGLSFSNNDRCDEVFTCPDFADEEECSHPSIFLLENENYTIAFSDIKAETYNVSLFRANASNGFRIRLLDIYLDCYNYYSYGQCDDAIIQIGTGYGNANSRSIVKTLRAFTSFEDDVHVDSSEMWISISGIWRYGAYGSKNFYGRGEIEVNTVRMNSLSSCAHSNLVISQDDICDGFYQCDDYSDEISCDHADVVLHEGESFGIKVNAARRSYNTTILRTNSTLGFRVHFGSSDYWDGYGAHIAIGTRNNSSPIYEWSSTSNYYSFSNDYDVYVTTNEIWTAIIGGVYHAYGSMEFNVTSVDIPDLYTCPGNSHIGIPQSRLCDGRYDCSNYEDESSCNESAILINNETFYFSVYPWDYDYQRLYRDWLFETNTGNGFRVDLYTYVECFDYYCGHDGVFTIIIGTGKDSTNQESVFQTFTTKTTHWWFYTYEELYVESQEIWIVFIGPQFVGNGDYGELNLDINAVNMSGWIPCKDSRTSVSPDYACNGRYECDDYGDETSCDRSPTIISEGESYAISDLELFEREYHAFILQTNQYSRFHIRFQHISLGCCDERVQIGTGTDLSDEESVIMSIQGYTNYVDDVYVNTTNMWLVMTGHKDSDNYPNGHVDMIVTAISLSANTDPCIEQDPCVHGVCINVGQGEYECECQDNYDGIHCDEPIRGCLSNPCLNGGTCNQLVDGGYRCDCMDTFTGLNCEIANTNPCVERNPCVHGVCINVEQGRYECECQDNYDGIHCDEPILPIEVSHHPSSQIVNINTNVNLTCGFNHAKRYRWYKTVREEGDGVLLPNSENQNPLMIMSASHNDIGYYFCRGEGRNGETLETTRASVYLRDLTNVEVLNVRFATPFREELRDQTSMIYKETASNITTFMGEGLKKSTGLEGVSVVCRALRPGSIEADLNIYLDDTNMTALDTEHLISESIQSMAENSNGFLDSSSISIQNNAICRNITWISPRLERVEFPVGENGSWANSTGRCPFNTTQADGPIGRALCIGDGITQSRWQPMDNCGPFRNVTDILTEIAEASITEENAGEVSQQVEAVSSNIEDITSDDVTLIAEITSSIVQQNVTNEQVTEDLTGTLSNVAEVQTDVLVAAEEAVSKLVEAFEEQINRVEVADGEMLNIQQPNVAVQIQSVSADEGMGGLVLSLAGSSLSDLTKANFTISAPTQGDHQDDDSIASKPDTIAQVNIPSSVSSAISSTNPLTGSSSNGSGEYIRINFNVFSTPALFISKSLREFSADNEAVNRSANTPVIAVSIGGRKIESLAESINFTFSTLMSGYVNPMCSFWDDEKADWAQDGCSLISRVGSTDDDNSYANSESTQEGSFDERVRCACDHLTNFAVLMDIRVQDSPEAVYNILTYIGCCLSILSLLVTLATYLWNKDLRTKQTSQIFICLCATLLCLYITFVIMISLDSIRDYREVQAGPCGFLSALVHYFVLSSIAWMGVEGYNTYLVIVKIFNTYIPNFMIKACLAAWGVPALIVLLTGVIARESYAHDDLCFLQFWAQIGGLLIPMSIILAINIVIFILVIRQLYQSANIAGRVKREAEVERRETIERVQNAICILLLLGLTWITGYLLLIPSFSPVAQPIFIVLNSFQGLFIFLLYCVRKPHIRKRWGLTCIDKKKEVSTSSGGVQSSLNPSSTSAGVMSGTIGLLSPGSSGNYLLPTNKDDPLCLQNPTYDIGQIAEEVDPPLDRDVHSSNNGQMNKDNDATDAGMVSFHVG